MANSKRHNTRYLVTRSNLLHLLFQKRPNQKRPEKRPRRDEEEAAVEDAAQEQQGVAMDVDQDQQEEVEAQDVGEPGLIGELMNPINCYGY